MRVVNQITFEAKDDAEALRLAGERLGREAVILSTRIVRTGGFLGLFSRRVLMVTAGVLQNDVEKSADDGELSKDRLAAFQRLLEMKQQNNRPMPRTSPPTSVREPYPAGELTKEADGMDSVQISYGKSLQTPGDETQLLRSEVHDLSKRLDMILARLPLDGEGMAPQPAAKVTAVDGGFSGEMASIYQRLIDSEVDAKFAHELVEKYRASLGKVKFDEWLGAKITCTADGSGDVFGGKKVMLLGPTGVGKTTTIAKLAAIQALWEHRSVLLLTSDTYRIAAVDQLRTYAKILGVPIEVIFEAENFDTVLREHADADLVLLDTAGRGQRDRKNLETFELLYNMYRPDAVHLVLAANMGCKNMLDVVERMSVVPITHVIFTKLDETVTYGALYNVMQVIRKPVSFFTTGQNVPNDIEVARGKKLASLLMGAELRSDVLK